MLTASRSNIKRSLEKYFNDNLNIIESFSINWEGLPFNNVSATEWLMPRILDFTPVYMRQGSTTQYADDLNIIFSINIFVKKSNITKSGREYAMRDIISKYFKIGEIINIYDYSGNGSSEIGSMKVRDIITDAMLPETEELYSYNITYLINSTILTVEV